MSELSRHYWEGAERGELVIQRCRPCGRWIHFPEHACPACGTADFAFEPVSGQGAVETFSVLHRSFVQAFAERTPYVIAWIALPEQAGLRVFANITGCDPAEVEIGMPVEVCFEDRDGRKVPNFKKKSRVWEDR